MLDRTRTTRASCFYEDVSWKPRLSKRSPFFSISNLAWIQSPDISVQGPPICSCRGLHYFCQAEFKHDGAARHAVFWPEPACRAAAAGRARRDLRGWYRRRRPRQPTSGSASTYRLRHNRKDSRIHTMSDLLGYLLVASDPLPSSLGLYRRRSCYWNRHGQLCSRRSWRCWQSRGRARPWWQKTRMTALTAATAVMTTTTTAAVASEARVEPANSWEVLKWTDVPCRAITCELVCSRFFRFAKDV